MKRWLPIIFLLVYSVVTTGCATFVHSSANSLTQKPADCPPFRVDCEYMRIFCNAGKEPLNITRRGWPTYADKIKEGFRQSATNLPSDHLIVRPTSVMIEYTHRLNFPVEPFVLLAASIIPFPVHDVTLSTVKFQVLTPEGTVITERSVSNNVDGYFWIWCCPPPFFGTHVFPQSRLKWKMEEQAIRDVPALILNDIYNGSYMKSRPNLPSFGTDAVKVRTSDRDRPAHTSTTSLPATPDQQPQPQVGDQTSQKKTPAERMLLLKKMLDKGTINQEDYEKKAEILKEL